MANHACAPWMLRAAGRLRSVNAAEPAKKMNFAREKLPSSTGWITAGSPAASVNVPTAISSSSSEKSQPAKRLSSSKDLSSAPRREDAPAITMRWESRGRGIELRSPGSDAVAERANDLQDKSSDGV